jgi:hypothetical protein
MPADNTGFVPYCSPKNKKGQTILASIDIYDQCIDMTAPEALLLSVTPEDMQTGITVQAARQFTMITTANSVTEVQSMYSGRPVTFTFNVQTGAFTTAIDEITEGDKYVDSSSRDGWKELRMADRTGEYTATYSVVITYRSGTETLAQDFIPNCEISSSTQGAMTAGQVYNRTIELKAQPIGDLAGTRVIRYRK